MSELTQHDLPKPPKTPEEIARKKEKKARKKAKKEVEKQVKDDRVYLAFERTLLAWVRTATNLLTFGFAIIKLMEAEAAKPGDHPMLRVVSPKAVGVTMIIAGLLGMLMAVINFAKHAKLLGRKTREVYGNPAMMVAYVIMLLCFMVILGAFYQISISQ
jgi:putative membrane protein